jgi:hypothetical protein
MPAVFPNNNAHIDDPPQITWLKILNVLNILAGAAGDGSNPVSDLPSKLYTGQNTVGTPGTAVNLPSALLFQGVVITALPGNKSQITVGPVGVTNATTGSGNGTVLAQGQATSFAVNNLNLLWINATNAGDGVSYNGS